MATQEQLKNRADWLVALRSGAYKQGQSFLGSETYGFCCLGVAATIAGVPTDDDGDMGRRYPYYMFPAQGGGKYSDDQMPPVSWFESRFDLPERIMRDAAAKNDGHTNFDFDKDPVRVPPQSFLEIADWLETEAFPANP